MKTTTSPSQSFASRKRPGRAFVLLLSVLAASSGAHFEQKAASGVASDLILVTAFSVSEGRASIQWSRLEGRYGYTLEYL